MRWGVDIEGTNQVLVDRILNAQKELHQRASLYPVKRPVLIPQKPLNNPPQKPKIFVTRATGKGKDLGLVTAEVLIGVNIFSDILTGIRDMFGGRAQSGERKLQAAMRTLLTEMKRKARAKGATQITNFHAEPFVYGRGTMVGLYGYGVARKGRAKVKKNPHCDCPKGKCKCNNPSGLKKIPKMEYSHDLECEQCGWEGSGLRDPAMRAPDTAFRASAPFAGSPVWHCPECKKPLLSKWGTVEKSNPSRTYKGIEITRDGKAWRVSAYNRTFKTLKATRAFISQKTVGSTKANARCPRKIKGKQCSGKIKKNNGNWKCTKCKSQFKEA